MMKIHISINDKRLPHASQLEWLCGSFEDLFKITQMYEYSATKFRGGKRNNESAIGVSIIILDVDEGISLAEGLEMFKEFKSLIVTTKSHQILKNGVITDRFRVILPLNVSIVDMGYYGQLMRIITRHYGTDIACTDSARYYSPNPNQKIYYSNSNKYFDIGAFDDMVEMNEDVMFADGTSSILSTDKVKSELLAGRVALDTNSVVIYYNQGQKSKNTLDYIIKNFKVSNSAIRCHCFLNNKHEDKHPSCFIYLNDNNVYAKCVACQRDGILLKENNKCQIENY